MDKFSFSYNPVPAKTNLKDSDEKLANVEESWDSEIRKTHNKFVNERTSYWTARSAASLRSLLQIR
ncbi:hypothetical protein D1814_15970 [Alteromonas sp. BL110]|uniref:hypothetical protein n=1 Tax=Alteromonas sp. BL110 TaxID=1714845 RepID=UPI000E489423|nr:hypothetical protein [Alteromonas sp. BL110]AXT40070.1 hypothetical protein D1814_15970 [Alteromonas sp. BL110]RKM79300.1 hypothetical protein D7031_09965 [Alteromonas sp. BL110]